MERALLVELTTYGFLHAGQGPLRREVLKRTWPWLPGAMLYGALQAALIRLDGVDGPRPRALVEALCGNTLRFTPLLPDILQQIDRASAYCQQAQRLAAEATGRQPRKPPVLRYQTTPHAPLSRRQAQIEGSLLFAVEGHQPFQRYRGWIFCTDALIAPLQQALGMLPLLPLGGKGKFTSAEAQVIAVTPTANLRDELVTQMPLTGQAITVELLTPLIFQATGWGPLEAPERVQVKSPRRYRAWRTGLYPNATTGAIHNYGVPVAENALGRVGQASAPVAGWPEGSRFGYTSDTARTAQLAQAFVSGAGRADWACLGWGQIFVHLPLEQGEEA